MRTPRIPRRALAVLLLSALPACAGPLADTMRERLEQRRQAAEAQPRIPLPAGARALMNQAYGPDAAHRLDVYIPAGTQRAPVLVIVHGGAWMFGDKGHGRLIENKAAHWLPRGVIIVSPNYRMSRRPQVLDQVDDIARAVAFVQAQAPSWGGDAARLALMGHSAGAHLVAMLASDARLAGAHAVKPWLGTVTLDSAALDLVGLMKRRHPGFYDRVFGSDPAFWAQASPLHRLQGAPLTPMLIVCSTQRDDACPAAQAYAAKAQAAGGKAGVLPVDLSHAEVNERLGLAGDYTDQVDRFMQSVGLP